MTTYILFQPTSSSVFQFNVTLDNQNYICSTPWNLAEQRYYLKIIDQFGNLILYRSLVGSPNNYNINLIAPLFSTSLVFRQSTQNFEITP